MNRLLFWAAPVLAFTLAAVLIARAATVGNYNDSAGNVLTAQGVMGLSSYPAGAVPITASSGNVANATAAATLPGVAGKTTYISGFHCDVGGATGAALAALTVTGLITGTQTYTAGAVAGATLISPPVERVYNPPVPASAMSTAIVVSMAALGTGNVRADCNAEGYQL
jgi:hypothetical protein